jgi:hypothetical protein
MTYDGSWCRPVLRREPIGRSQVYGDRYLGVKCVGKFGPLRCAAQFPRQRIVGNKKPRAAGGDQARG